MVGAISSLWSRRGMGSLSQPTRDLLESLDPRHSGWRPGLVEASSLTSGTL
jgi:hypothetical protein